MPGVKGRRVPGRPGRFDPTIPLHMTTRRSAKGVSGMDMYPDDEYDDSESRRTSLDDASVETPYSAYGSEPPVKRQRTADPSPEQTRSSVLGADDLSNNEVRRSSGIFGNANGVTSGSQTSSGGGFVSQMDVDVSQTSIDPLLRDGGAAGDDQDASHPVYTTEHGNLVPQSRRKLDEAPLDDDNMRQQDEDANGVHVGDHGTGADDAGDYSQIEPTQSQSQEFEVYQSQNQGKWAEVVDQLPSMKVSASREASVESSRSDARAVRNIPLPEISTDATPMATRQGSPATTASAAAEEITPARTKAQTNLELTATDEEEDNDGQPAAQNNDSLEAMEEEADVTRFGEDYEEDDAPAPKATKRRFAGGRRRAAHSNVVVESAMRRQLELKQIYRQVTRSMKSCLGELAQITLDELATDQHHHEQVSEYETVIAELNEQLEQRKQQLLNAQKFNHEQLLQRYHAERDSRVNRCRNLLEDIKEQQLVNLEYNMLQVNRARLRDEPGHETEDEDGVIPRPKRMAYRFKRSNAIDSRYDSRSRFTMETERRIQDLECRTKMWEALREYDANPENAFTIMDSSIREAAQERRRNVDITKHFADIATEYDRMCNAPAPPKAPPPPTAEELAPLNQLADLAVKPSLLSQRSRLSSTRPGYPEQSPRQSSRSSLPSQSLFDRSTGPAPHHPPPSSFLQVAMEPTRGPAHGYGQSSGPPLPSLGMRQPDSIYSPLSSSVGRGVDGRPTLAAKPAVYFDHSGSERFTPTNPLHGHHTHHQGLHNVGNIDNAIQEDRFRSYDRVSQEARAAHEARAAQEARAAARHSLSSAIGQRGNEAEHAQAEAARHNRSLPPPPTTGASGRPWQSPISSRADRDSFSGPEGGRRMKREREDDDLDSMQGRRTIPRNEPHPEPRRRRSSAESLDGARDRKPSTNQRIADEEATGPKRKTHQPKPFDEPLRKSQAPPTYPPHPPRRNSQASDVRPATPPWQQDRRASNQSAQQPNQQGPAPPMAAPPALAAYPTGSWTSWRPPQAPAVDHLGSGQGLAGPYGYQGMPSQQQQQQQGQQPSFGAVFRDMENRR